jgi:hypothetical protein
MSGSGNDWYFGGSADVTANGKINLPSRLFSDEVFDADRVVYWSHERGMGFVILSDQPLKKDLYKTHKNANIGDPPSYRTNIPKIFFSDYKGQGRGMDEPPLPEKARVQYGEQRVFAYKSEMMEPPIKSCYMFNLNQFDNTIGDDGWAEPLDDIPRFL